MTDTLWQAVLGAWLCLVSIQFTVATLISLGSACASLVVVAAAAIALEKMNRNTARSIFYSYLLLFAGGAASTASAVIAVFNKPMNEWQHLSMLIMLSGLSLLFLCTRRRARVCAHCPCRRSTDGACSVCGIRPCDLHLPEERP